MSTSDHASKPGHRKDGQPYKAGNTRDDGSYAVGKNRTSQHTRFQKGDGRPRGKREKGSKNQATIWRKALHRKMTLNGETKLATEWLVDAVIRRGITRSDRAAENALEQAERLDQAKERTVSGREDEIIAAYLAQRFAELGVEISEDVTEPKEDNAGDTETGDSDAN